MNVLKKTGVSVALLVLGMVLGTLLVGPADMVQGQATDQGDPNIFVHLCIKRSGEAKIADSFDACQPNDQAIALTSEDGYNELLAAILAEQAAREDAITQLQASQTLLIAEVAELKQALAEEQAARIAADTNHGNTMAQLFYIFKESIEQDNEDKEYILNKLKAIEEIQKALRDYLNELRDTCIEELDVCPFQSLPPL